MADLDLVTLVVKPSDPVDLSKKLLEKRIPAVLFPPCADVLLSLAARKGLNPDKNKEEVPVFFGEYFGFGRHHIFPKDVADKLGDHLPEALLKCINLNPSQNPQSAPKSAATSGSESWPGQCCVCSLCVMLNGTRNSVGGIKRLFVGDLVWLYFFERMGIFQILGAVLDAFASNGRLPISNGVVDLSPTDVMDDIVAVVLEVMVRQMKMGTSSTVRDRASAYRTSLGWVSDAGRKLGLDTVVNAGFNSLFHKFIFHALEYYKDKRLAVAIQGVSGGGARPSVTTLITIRDTIEVLRKRFEAFDYGRNHSNALNGIVWAIAGMSVVRELSTTLGIPPAYGDTHEYLSAAYDILVLKRPVTHGETNRFIVHRECATNARDILIDLEVVDHQKTGVGQELENWLNQIEAKVEGYRTAYRTLTGVDLGAPGTPTIEQQA